MDVSAVTRDEVIYVQAKSSNRETRTIPTSVNEKRVKRKIFIFLLVNIYYYLIKHLAKKNIYYHMSSQATN